MEKENKKEKIKNGLKALLEEALEELQESSQIGENFDSENYYNALRIAKKHLPEEEIKEYETKYNEINNLYWENKRKKELD
tara:strand:+ start:1082 stop:1324 length:243 start_codon:yes stop_codon:yes gene_type:complete